MPRPTHLQRQCNLNTHWQHQIQNPVPVRASRFESGLWYYNLNPAESYAYLVVADELEWFLLTRLGSHLGGG